MINVTPGAPKKKHCSPKTGWQGLCRCYEAPIRGSRVPRVGHPDAFVICAPQMPFSLSVFPTLPFSLCLPCASPEAPPMPYPLSLSLPRVALSLPFPLAAPFDFSLYPLPTPLSTLPEATLSLYLYLLSTAPLSLALPSSGVSMRDLADCPLLSDRICGILSHRGIDLLGFPASDPTVVLYFTLIMATEVIYPYP